MASEDDEISVVHTRGRSLLRQRRGPSEFKADEENASDPEITGATARSRRREDRWNCRRTREMRRWNSGRGPCVVIRQSGAGAGGICMDMEEVIACHDLGLELPRDWTVELPVGSFSGESSVSASGADSEAEDVKARLRVWAQAVALASASAGLLSF